MHQTRHGGLPLDMVNIYGQPMVDEIHRGALHTSPGPRGWNAHKMGYSYVIVAAECSGSHITCKPQTVNIQYI